MQVGGNQDVQRDRVVQLVPQKADEEARRHQFREQRADNHGSGHKGLRAELEGVNA